jgi:hypothetical protein
MYHRLCGLNNRHFFLIVLKAGKCKIKVQADSVLSECFLPGLQMATFSLCPHREGKMEEWKKDRRERGEKERERGIFNRNDHKYHLPPNLARPSERSLPSYNASQKGGGGWGESRAGEGKGRHKERERGREESV